MPLMPGCCCECGECPTKEDTGLPDSLVTNFDVLTSDDTGMPSDTVSGSCDGGDYYARWSHSSALIDLLTSIVWDYVEAASPTSCGCCCFRYEGRTDYTPACPAMAADGVLLGESPFDPIITGDEYNSLHFEGTDAAEDTTGDLDCCDGFFTTYNHQAVCEEVCGTVEQWSGLKDIPLNAYASESNLYICVQDSVVTICIGLTIAVECQEQSGDYEAASQDGSEGYSCYTEYPEVDDTTTSCGTNTSSELYLTATADLTAVSGSDIWEKIKNAPAETWSSEYESAHCNCGTGGCVGEGLIQLCGCIVGPFCVCDRFDAGTDPPSGACDGTELLDDPIDRDCIYAVGTVDMAFADE